MKERKGIGVLNAENYFITLNFPPVLVGVFSLAMPRDAPEGMFLTAGLQVVFDQTQSTNFF